MSDSELVAELYSKKMNPSTDMKCEGKVGGIQTIRSFRAASLDG